MKLKKHITESHFSGTDTEDEITDIENTGREISSYNFVFYIRYYLPSEPNDSIDDRQSAVLQSVFEQYDNQTLIS